jgi:hypothetical protein
MPVKYALLLYGDEAAWESVPENQRQEVYGRYRQLGEWLTDRGWMRGGDELASASTATCVRIENGRTVTTDGPFTETKEQLGGFYLIECENLDQAIEVAGRIPVAERGTVEVRPIVDNS